MAFSLSGGNLLAKDMADQFLNVLDEIATACLEGGPLLYAVTMTGLRRIEL